MADPKKLDELKMMRIGVDNVTIALVKRDDIGIHTETEKKIEYDTLYSLPGVMTLNINPNVSMETAYYDNGPADVASTLGNIEVSFTKSSLNQAEQSFMLGKLISKNGFVVTAEQASPPYLALGFRTLKSDGTYRYVWMLKGKFSEPADNNETKGESINFQSQEITGRFVRTNCHFEVTDLIPATNREAQLWKTEFENGEVPVANSTGDKWFNQVVLPTTQL